MLYKHSILFLALGITLSAPSHAGSDWWNKGIEYIKDAQAASKVPEPSETAERGATSTTTTSFTSAELEKAFRQALNIGAENVVSQLGMTDGFNLDPKIHINLPGSLQNVDRILSRFGYGSLTEELELKLNRAAEEATPQAKTLFIESIKRMTFNDVQKIYNGGQDSATQYLKSKTEDKIREKMAPIVAGKLQEVGAIQLYDKVMAQYMSYPLVPNISANLQEHVLDKSVDGIFYYLAEEEKAIRQDPVKQTTELLKKVFQQ